jgi:hypothetical protein
MIKTDPDYNNLVASYDPEIVRSVDLWCMRPLITEFSPAVSVSMTPDIAHQLRLGILPVFPISGCG